MSTHASGIFSSDSLSWTLLAELLLGTVAAAALFEAAGWTTVLWLKRNCPWIVTRTDLRPRIDRGGLERFLAHGWDRDLGWVRKPGTSGVESGAAGTTAKYAIDDLGARVNPGFDASTPFALVFGDSFAFCRQVNDDETWPNRLSHLSGKNVENYGVGNYGLDQAALRLERDFAGRTAPLIIMSVVPETISRVLSTWKHFSEYGNTLGFKPRFRLDATGGLELMSNPIEVPADFDRIPDLLPILMERDEFYRRKFARDMLSFPLLLSLARSRRRNLPLIWYALLDRLGGGGKRAFCSVMERNIGMAATLYREPEARALLLAITRRFAEFVQCNRATPVLLLLPQLFDLKRLRAGDHFYKPYVDEAGALLEVIDLGPFFAERNQDSVLYIDDRFGGHLSAAGNRLVAEQVFQRLGAALAVNGGVAVGDSRA